jgi:hypothetical protein
MVRKQSLDGFFSVQPEVLILKKLIFSKHRKNNNDKEVADL